MESRNKGAAIREVLRDMPSATAEDIVAEVKRRHGHTVSKPYIYLTRHKEGVTRRTPSDAADLVDAIRTAKQLLAATGNADRAAGLVAALAE